ncbi:MAG: class I SAM-dependent methyltransferase, partial [Terriglobales bacterium]
GETMTHGHDLAPSPWIARFAPLVAEGARVLDLAAGLGRHARWFANRGARVVAVDRDAALLSTMAGIAGIETRILDLETGAWPLHGEHFDAIVVVNYLHRPLFPHLAASLAPDGVLIYETFMSGNERYGKPSNPEFLLRPGELLDAFRALRVLAFEQGSIVAPKPAVIQRLCASAGRKD